MTTGMMAALDGHDIGMCIFIEQQPLGFPMGARSWPKLSLAFDGAATLGKMAALDADAA